MKNKAKDLLKIFLTFLKIGAFTFGGGYAMIPLIQKETVEKNKWVKDEEILEIIAIAESTPGPISINTATFIGYKVAGFLGALLGTVGLIIPSFIIISIVYSLLNMFNENIFIQYAFYGIRAGVLALIINALFTMYKKIDKNYVSYFLILISIIGAIFFNINVIYIIAFCALVGLISSIFNERRIEK